MDARQFPVEYEYDPEARNWVFTVPKLHIVGGGITREDAERREREAIDFTLEYMQEQGEAVTEMLPKNRLTRY
jgi:predicted RNase H-like HicB family nuclease